MHLPDDFISNGVAGGLIGASALALALATRFVKKQYFYAKVVLKKKLALEGGLSVSSGFELSKNFKSRIIKRLSLAVTFGSFIFVMQMFDFEFLPGITGHFLGGALLAFVLGPFEGLIVMSLILIIQSFALADGGVVALGANIFNMGVVGVVLSYYLFRFLFEKTKRRKKDYYFLVFFLAWLSVFLMALLYGLELKISGQIGSSSFYEILKQYSFVGIFESIITIIALYTYKNKKRLKEN